jgi:hypothetical protein
LHGDALAHAFEDACGNDRVIGQPHFKTFNGQPTTVELGLELGSRSEAEITIFSILLLLINPLNQPMGWLAYFPELVDETAIKQPVA